MATVTGYTAARMKEIEDSAIVGGLVTGGNLILTRYDGTQVNAGPVVGPTGPEGPAGDTPDAPVDGVSYVRKDETWVDLETLLGPEDGKKYVRQDGAWVLADRPWKLEFNDTTAPLPTGFSSGDLAAGTTWAAKFSGSGYSVNYSLEFTIMGSDIDSDPRFTLPTSLRPVVDTKSIAHFNDPRTGWLVAGTAIAKIKTNGDILTPQDYANIMVQNNTAGESTSKISKYASSLAIRVLMSGSYTRSVIDLPSTAVYV